MHRRDFLATSSFALIAAALKELPVHGEYQAQPPAPTVTKFQDLRGGIGIFTGRGGTIGWFATRDGVLVVDSQYVDTAQACIEGLKQKSPHAIDILINTHHHGDHTAGNKVFRPVVRTIVAHANSAVWQKKAAETARPKRIRRTPTRRSPMSGGAPSAKSTSSGSTTAPGTRAAISSSHSKPRTSSTWAI